jgi:methylated-DNA-protein-cysteine methyltransferase related protein
MKRSIKDVQRQSVSEELAVMILNVVAIVPYGKVVSYGQVAAMAGLPKHARLVGRVLSRMDEDSEIPWHRVINSQGRISLSRLDDHGYNVQQAKLLSEGVAIVNGKVSFKAFGWTGA